MDILFVTGADATFFPTLLVTMQSFADRIEAQPLYVCDYGLEPPQAEFLRRRGLLLEFPPTLMRGLHPYRYKGALHEFIQNSVFPKDSYDAVVWLDGDLTLLNATFADFTQVVAEMMEDGAEIALTPTIDNLSIAELTDSLEARGQFLAPFRRLVADTAVDPALPYLSCGILFCRNMDILERWRDLSLVITHHHLVEQNVLNVLLRRNGVPLKLLDCRTWQLYDAPLDRVASALETGIPAEIDGQKLLILHTSSSKPDHLFVRVGTLQAGDVVLEGVFKLFMPETLLSHQLNLLARFLGNNGPELVELGICRRADTFVDGMQFNAPAEEP